MCHPWNLLGITSTGALFRAAVNPNGAATTAWFDWGTTINYTLSTPPQLLGGGTTNIFVSAGQPLPTTQTYFFRIHATNVLGTSLGTNLAFTWVPTRPMFVQPAISSGLMYLQFSGAVHQTYLILTSANLTTWSLFSTAVDNGNGAFTFQDPTSPTVAKRFYRVLVP